MEWTNQWIERGRALGLTQAKREGYVYVLSRVLCRRFGPDAGRLELQLMDLTLEELGDCADSLDDFITLADAEGWITNRVLLGRVHPGPYADSPDVS